MCFERIARGTVKRVLKRQRSVGESWGTAFDFEASAMSRTHAAVGVQPWRLLNNNAARYLCGRARHFARTRRAQSLVPPVGFAQTLLPSARLKLSASGGIIPSMVISSNCNARWLALSRNDSFIDQITSRRRQISGTSRNFISRFGKTIFFPSSSVPTDCF